VPDIDRAMEKPKESPISPKRAEGETGRQAELLKAEDLVKRFQGVTAVDGASFSVRRGEIFGFLGPNGAGKTTTINLLTGLARPTSGSMYLEGREYTAHPKRAQALMGIVPDESNLYDELDGFGNLTFCAALYGIEKAERQARAGELLEQFGLKQAGKRPFKAYSKGMKRKLTIAAGIIHRPKILFLDEPTTGIDVASARQIRVLIGELNRSGTTVFLTTHYIEEAERLCHRIAFIVGGRLVRIGSLEELMKEHQQETVLELAVDHAGDGLAEELRRRFPGYAVHRADERHLRLVSEGSIELLPLLEAVAGGGTEVSEARLIRPTLEEVFVRVTGIESALMRQEREGKKK
jgi:ABC-2 type transport system ATP-binding protein